MYSIKPQFKQTPTS